MALEETRANILSSEDFLVEELRKVQILYELKKIIRYNHTREAEQHTESDAEHIFGMHCLVDYFLPLEDIEGKWNRDHIRTMVQYHEIDEIVTGDKVSYEKTESDRAQEAASIEPVIVRLPETMQDMVRETLHEYKQQESDEARFVKAIDKIEPVFHLYNQTGKETLHTLKTKQEEHMRIKEPYVQDFPIIKRFTDVMNERFQAEGYYIT
jgi:5'-deoxynucleotidase YfbR-like HD superfamily hydrolase